MTGYLDTPPPQILNWNIRSSTYNRPSSNADRRPHYRPATLEKKSQPTHETNNSHQDIAWSPEFFDKDIKAIQRTKTQNSRLTNQNRETQNFLTKWLYPKPEQPHHPQRKSPSTNHLRVMTRFFPVKIRNTSKPDENDSLNPSLVTMTLHATLLRLTIGQRRRTEPNGRRRTKTTPNVKPLNNGKRSVIMTRQMTRR